MNTSLPLISAKRLVSDARVLIENLTPADLAGELGSGRVVLVDLRDQAEREEHGVIPEAIHVPRGMLEFCADPSLPVHVEQLDPARRIVVHCASGARSALGALTLLAMGFPDVAHLDGGFEAWRRAGGALERAR